MSTVSYITIPIASLNIDSPKTIAYKLTSASISLNMARTETGSVALIKLPKAKDSFQLKSGESGVYPTAQNRTDEVKIAMKVPKKEKASTVPKFAKKDVLFILKPDSKMIGGKSRIINIVPKCFDTFVKYSSISKAWHKRPARMPTNTVRPASYRYLCLDFLR